MADENNSLVNLVMDRFLYSQRAREPWTEMWLRCYRLYRGYRTELPPEEADRSNLHIPKVFAHVETILPRTVAATLSRRPWVAIHPREPNDELPAKRNEKLFEYQAERQDLFSKLVGFYKEGLMYGTSIGKTYWRHEVKTRRVVERRDLVVPGPFGRINLTRLFNMDPVYVEVEKDVVMWDDPWFEHVNLFDFYGDPDGKSIADMAWCIHRSWASMEELEKAGIYSNLDEIPDRGGYDDERGIDMLHAEIGRAGGRGSEQRSRKIELLEHWEDDRVITVANRSVVIRDEENPFWHGSKPFVAMVTTPLPHEFYGVGIIEPIRYLQEELNTARNQRRDNISLALHRMFFASRDANIDPDDLVWRPGGVVWVDGIDDVRKMIHPVEVPDVTSSSYQEEIIMSRDMEDATGATDFARGVPTRAGTTAREVAELAAATNARVDLAVRLMAYQGLRGIARHWVGLNQQFMTEPRFIRITGENDWETVRPEDIAGEFDFVPAAANVESFANRDRIRADIIDMLSLSANPVDAQIVDRRELWRRLIELSEIGDVDRIIPESPIPTAAPSSPTDVGAEAALAAAGGAVDPMAAFAGGVQPGGPAA